MVTRKKVLTTVYLEQPTHTFGRLNGLTQLGAQMLRAVLFQHFAISREVGPSWRCDPPPVYITDLSMNGTYVNGMLIGKGNRRILKSFDVIAILQQKSQLFTFKDGVSPASMVSLPMEISCKYYTSPYVIGRGTYGKVYKAYELITCKEYAVKKIKKRGMVDNEMDEITVMRQLKHPCIIELVEVVDGPLELFIVMEYMAGGTLFDLLNEKYRLPERQAKIFFYQLCEGVSYLHRMDIVHRDLKTVNILLASKNEPYTRLKIIDFGFSKTAKCLRSLVGTTV